MIQKEIFKEIFKEEKNDNPYPEKREDTREP
jgi:hypothetical protein